MTDRRANQPDREQAQRWFDALRTHLAAADAQNDVAERLRNWATLEDLLGDCPRLLPPLLTMAWQLRHEPAFTELFQTSTGIAEDTTTKLKACGKSFDQVVLSHLQGAMRVYCDRQEKAWLAAEKARHRPSGLMKVRFLAPLLKRLLKQRDQDFLAHYPQHDLYPVLKPWLRHPNQFALIEALATLPTSTVAILGDTVRGLSIDSGIRNLAALESRKCKFIVGLARTFADTAISEAEAARAVGMELNLTPAPVPANAPEIAGTALSYFTQNGLHLTKGAIAVRENARNIVEKMTVCMSYGLWEVFADKEWAMNVAKCPAFLARTLGNHAARVHRKTSEALNTLSDQRIVEAVVVALFNAGGRDALADWAANPNCAIVWGRIAKEIKQILTQHGEAAVTPETIATFCQGLVPSFTALHSGSVAQPVAETEGAA